MLLWQLSSKLNENAKVGRSQSFITKLILFQIAAFSEILFLFILLVNSPDVFLSWRTKITEFFLYFGVELSSENSNKIFSRPFYFFFSISNFEILRTLQALEKYAIHSSFNFDPEALIIVKFGWDKWWTKSTSISQRFCGQMIGSRGFDSAGYIEKVKGHG